MKKIIVLLFISFSINAIAQESSNKSKKALIELQLTPHTYASIWLPKVSSIKYTITPLLRFEYAYAQKNTIGFRTSYDNALWTKQEYLGSFFNVYAESVMIYKASVFNIGIETTTYKRKYNAFDIMRYIFGKNLKQSSNNASSALIGKFRTFGIYYNHIGTPSTEIESSVPLSDKDIKNLTASGTSNLWQLGYTQGTRFLIKDKLTVNVGTKVNLPLNINTNEGLSDSRIKALALKNVYALQNFVQFYVAVGFLR